MYSTIYKSNTIKQRESENFDIVRTFAILSVIAAHTNNYVQSPLSRQYITFFWGAYGATGVAIFMILGGFFYNVNNGDLLKFWKKKAKYLLLPWLFCSTSMYFLYAFVNGSRIGLLNYLEYILGYGTWYYYMTVYCICLIVFKYFKNSISGLIAAIVVTVISLTLCNFGVYMEVGYINVYLNPLNWIGFFSIGVLIRKFRLDKYIINNSIIQIIFIIMLFILYLIMVCIRKNSYFSVITGLWSVCSFVLVLALVDRIKCKMLRNLLAGIGRVSFCIYLLHMPIVQPICNLMPQIWICDFVKPFIGLFLVSFVIYIMEHIVDKLPGAQSIKILVGIRNSTRLKRGY